jgi:hypothetical protein
MTLLPFFTSSASCGLPAQALLPPHWPPLLAAVNYLKLTTRAPYATPLISFSINLFFFCLTLNLGRTTTIARFATIHCSLPLQAQLINCTNIYHKQLHPVPVGGPYDPPRDYDKSGVHN